MNKIIEFTVQKYTEYPNEYCIVFELSTLQNSTLECDSKDVKYLFGHLIRKMSCLAHICIFKMDCRNYLVTHLSSSMLFKKNPS